MDIFKPIYSGPQFAELNNMSPDSLYDWRRRGVDLGLAAAVNGQKKYTVYDCLEAFVLSELRLMHYDDIPTAFRRARVVTPQIARMAGISLHGLAGWVAPGVGRFVMADNLGGVKVSDDLNQILSMKSAIVEVLDADHLFAVIWPKFQKKMQGAGIDLGGAKAD